MLAHSLQAMKKMKIIDLRQQVNSKCLLDLVLQKARHLDLVILRPQNILEDPAALQDKIITTKHHPIIQVEEVKAAAKEN